MQNRRSFLTNCGIVLAAAYTLPLVSCGKKNFNSFDPLIHNKFGLQLYSLKESMVENAKETIKNISSYGYKLVETFDSANGLYFGMTNKEFLKYINDLGMGMVSAHFNPKEDVEKKIEGLAEIGVEYAIVPYVGPQETLDKFKEIADQFNKWGEICKQHNIKLAYHNHDYSFTKLEDKYPQDIFMEMCDPNLVEFQMDIYWVVTAGENPIEWIKKYPNRFALCHIKDRKKEVPMDSKMESCDLGTGIIDFNEILKVAKENGMKRFIVEQEKYENGSPLDSIKRNSDFMRALSI